MRTWNDPEEHWITELTDLTIETDRRIQEIQLNVYYVDVGSSQPIETVNTKGTSIRSTSDPYYSFSTSLGTISKITPYTYKLKANGDANVTGRPIRQYDPTDNDYWTPFKVGSMYPGVETITLNDFYGLQEGLSQGGMYSSFWYNALMQLMTRGRSLYTFTWRGDPKLQPRDLLRVQTRGVYAKLTIESITLSHEGGGLVSQIVARERW